MGCGICGFAGLSDKRLLVSMAEVIRHRGPDLTDYYLDGGVGLGVDRLSVIDLVSGDQPIHNEDESVWVVHNGEVYNYKELRARLEAEGHSFYTETDTEALVHSYEEWGDDVASYLGGMFASAIWDAKLKKLYLMRDRFGKKPLYYTLREGALLFASELKSLLQYPGVGGRMNYDSLDRYFTFGYVPSPLTIFEGVYKLPPGHYATFEKGKFATHQYWDFAPNPDLGMDEDVAVEQLYSAAKEAVRVRLKSDVPLGAFLSGGIDSSVVVALMASQSESTVKTTSIGFNDSLSEISYSRQVAEYLNTDHKEYTVTPEAYKILPKLIWHFDEPFADHSLIPTYYLSQVARKSVTVALSGDGGDEMFMGYPFLAEPRISRLYSSVPAPARRLALKVVVRFPRKGSYSRMAQHALEKDYGDQSQFEKYVMRVSLVDADGLRRMYSHEFVSGRSPSDAYGYMMGLLEQGKPRIYLDAADYATVKSYLSEDILTKVDRMSMANSLEVRCPLLDWKLASLVERMPSHFKMRGGLTKYIFKKMVVKKNLIPRNIAYRAKQGFGAPIQSWMGKDWKEMMQQVMDPVINRNYTHLLDPDNVGRMLREPYLNANKLFAISVFVIWHRIYVDKEKVGQVAV